MRERHYGPRGVAARAAAGAELAEVLGTLIRDAQVRPHDLGSPSGAEAVADALDVFRESEAAGIVRAWVKEERSS